VAADTLMASPAGGVLMTRVATGVVLVAVALGALYAGGLVWTGLAALAVLLMFAEWAVMFRLPRGVRLAGLAIVALGPILAVTGPATQAVIAVAGGAGLLGLFARRLQTGAGFWVAAGVLYCGLPGIALVWLRAQNHGFALTLLAMAIVWSADIGAYFSGRAIGGPKLAPSISPNKTWAGALGGALAALLVAMAFVAVWLGGFAAVEPVWLAVAAGLGVALAVVSILGDLFESGLKRRAGVKDSGTLLPGHGGVLDRLDGLVPVACVAAPLFWLVGLTGR
jgi:phosphatidate cytidylyltransferase